MNHESFHRYVGTAASRVAVADKPHPAPPSGTMRSVRRAVTEARSGLPVIVTGPAPLIVLAAETASQDGLNEFLAMAQQPPVLLMAPSRAVSILSKFTHDKAAPADFDTAEPPVVAITLPAGSLNVETLLALADPTSVQPALATLLRATIPPASDAALQVARLGRLLPVVLAAPADSLDATPGLLHVAADDLRAYPLAAATTLKRVAEASVPLQEAANARLVAFRPEDGGIEHLALLIGRPEDAPAPLVRIHSECFTGDLLGSLRCDCGPQLHQAIRRMVAEGAGVLLYLAQEGRGIGLVNKLRAYALQDLGLDTLDANRALGWGADERSFAPAATMLHALGVARVRLLTNNPDKIASLRAHGIDVVGRVAHAIAANGINDAYLETKARRMGHLLG